LTAPFEHRHNKSDVLMVFHSFISSVPNKTSQKNITIMPA
jgi:hypothetical protein